MPGNLLFSDALFPQVGENEGWRTAARKILNYQYLLKEQLAYTLHNLDGENFNQGGWDKLTQPIYAKLNETVSGSQETLRAELSVRAGEILAQVAADYASGSSLAALSATVDSQGSRLSLLVTASGGQNAINAASIVAAVNGAGSSVKLNADKLDLNGYVTMSNLADSNTTTTINGANICSGTIQGVELISSNSQTAKTVSIYDGSIHFRRYSNGITMMGPELFYDSSDNCLQLTGVNPDDGLLLTDAGENNYIQIDGGAEGNQRRLALVSSGYIYLKAKSSGTTGAVWEFRADGLYKDGIKVL